MKKTIEKVLEENNVTEVKVKDIRKIFDMIKNELKNGNKVSITAFGIFSAKTYSQRKARNPRTGETFVLAETTKPKFKISKNFTKILN